MRALIQEIQNKYKKLKANKKKKVNRIPNNLNNK